MVREWGGCRSLQVRSQVLSRPVKWAGSAQVGMTSTPTGGLTAGFFLNATCCRRRTGLCVCPAGQERSRARSHQPADPAAAAAATAAAGAVQAGVAADGHGSLHGRLCVNATSCKLVHSTAHHCAGDEANHLMLCLLPRRAIVPCGYTWPAAQSTLARRFTSGWRAAASAWQCVTVVVAVAGWCMAVCDCPCVLPCRPPLAGCAWYANYYPLDDNHGSQRSSTHMRAACHTAAAC